MKATRTTGTAVMRDGFKIFLGDCLQGRVFTPWVIGEHYDWEYRLEWIKTNSDYSEFYLMCPLQGPTPIGSTLDEALDNIDLMHAEAYKEDAQHEIDKIKKKKSKKKSNKQQEEFCADDIPF